MLQLTKRTEYGLIALLHLASREGEIVSVREIGEHYPIPKRLLAETVKELTRAGLLASQRGASGGYCLARPADEITLGEVVSALEGPPSLTSCQDLAAASADGTCEVQPTCPIRSPLQRLRLGIWGLMQNTTLRALTDSSHPAPGHPAAGHLASREAAFAFLSAPPPKGRPIPARGTTGLPHDH